MISFEQVLLLEERVESAVKKIEQLNAENAALRRKCAELSNALNAKSEQFSTFQNDQSKIEEGILKALSRLSAVENVVLSAAGAAETASKPAPVSIPEPQIQNQIHVQNPVQSNNEAVVQTQEEPQLADELPSEIEIPSQPQQNVVPEQTQHTEPSNESASDIGFEFGDSDVSGQPAEASQPMFDIF